MKERVLFKDVDVVDEENSIKLCVTHSFATFPLWPHRALRSRGSRFTLKEIQNENDAFVLQQIQQC